MCKFLLSEVCKGSTVNKAYQSKKWWNIDVVSRLVCLHFEYLKRNGTGKVQNALSLSDIAAATKRKFDQDSTNRDDAIKEKRMKEEAEKKLLSDQRAQALESQIATGNSLKQMAEGMMAFMSPEPAARARQQAVVEIEARSAEELRDLTARMTNLENNVRTGFADINTGFADIKEMLRNR